MNATPIKTVSAYKPQKLKSGRWQVRWRVFYVDSTEKMRKASFDKRGQAEAFADRLKDADVGRDGWSLTATGDPIQADGTLTGPSVAEVVLDHYWPAKWGTWAPNGRRAASYGLVPFLRGTMADDLSAAAEDYLNNVAFTVDDTDPEAEGRRDLFAASMKASAIDRQTVQGIVTAAGRGKAINTERRIWSAIGAFLNWAATADLMPTVAGVSVRSEAAEDQVNVADLPDSQELSHFIGTWAQEEFGGERLRALVWVLAGAGLRIGEAIALDVGNVSDGEGGGLWLRVNKSLSEPSERFLDSEDERVRGTKAKGNVGNRKGRTAYLPAGEPADAMRRHLEEFAAKQPNAPLFTKPNGDRITRDFIVNRWKRAAKAAFPEPHRLSGLTRHTLRHVFATAALAAGTPLAALCQLGGWDSPHTVLRVYVQAMQGDTALAAERLDSVTW